MLSTDKKIEIGCLLPGDEIVIRNRGKEEVHTVVKVKRVNITTSYKGKQYNCPMELFVKVHKKVDLNKKIAEEAEDLKRRREEYKTLQQGEPFWFKSNNGKDAVVLYFEGFSAGKIIGISPVDNIRWKVAESMYGGKINFPNV